VNRSEFVSRLRSSIHELQEAGAELGYKNILQPGLIKEILIADTLGHRSLPSKQGANASAGEDLFEYVTCAGNNGTFQWAVMYADPPEKKERSLDRIRRIAAVFCAVFDEDNPVGLIRIFRVATSDVLSEVSRQLDRGKSPTTVHLRMGWVREFGRLVWER
jgi:hypothetical protein